MAVKRKPDSCEFPADGQIKITFGGVQRLLRRPTVGELKKFNKMLIDLAQRQKVEGSEEVDLDTMVTATLEWWCDVIDTLKGEDEIPCPADLDDLPTWLTNADLMVKMQNHWREVPWASGGN
jgi:hypothetical protein